jgi:hypothetical protein
MELLIPFFEKRKENLSHYGIEQCLIIDHHPNWRNTTTAVINVGNNGFNPPTEADAKSNGGAEVIPMGTDVPNRSAADAVANWACSEKTDTEIV